MATNIQITEKIPVTLEIYNNLKNKIISLDLIPGQILMVQQLSRELGISRTPVREAIIRLRDDGLVEEISGRKFRVTNITWKMIDDIYETRQALEGLALYELAKVVTPEQTEQLHQIVMSMKSAYIANNHETFFFEDNKFHSSIFEMHNNRVMIASIERIRDQQQRIRFLTNGAHSRMENSIDEHLRIVRYLEEGNSQHAMAELKLHLELARNDTKFLLYSRYPAALVKD